MTCFVPIEVEVCEIPENLSLPSYCGNINAFLGTAKHSNSSSKLRNSSGKLPKPADFYSIRIVVCPLDARLPTRPCIWTRLDGPSGREQLGH